MWQRLSDSLSWSQGHLGKGYLLHDGTVKTWNVDPRQPTTQSDIHLQNRELSPIALNFEVDPDGGVVTEQPTKKVESILAVDPRLYDAGQRPEFEDDFNLDNFEPEKKQVGSPDYNYIQSSNEESWLPIPMHGCPKCHRPYNVDPEDTEGACPHCGYSIPYDGAEAFSGLEHMSPDFHAVTNDAGAWGEYGDPHFGAWKWHPPHRNRWTGKLCDCGWGQPGHRGRRHAHIIEAGQQLNRVLKAPDKAYKTPEGQAFLEHLKNFSEQTGDTYDSLMPWLAQRFKKGDIRLRPGDPEAVAHGTRNPRLEYQQTPGHTVTRQRLEPLDPANPAAGSDYQPYEEEIPARWANAEYQLERWHQWYEARQHPTRRGVNVMDPNFGVQDMQEKAYAHEKALEEARAKERWLAEYAHDEYNKPNIVHHFGPEAGPYKGYHVVKLDPFQAEGDGAALGHCIGSDEQPYKYNIGQGNIDAYSLRDPEGYPHASWHFNPSGHDIGHMQGRSGDPDEHYRDLMSKFHAAKGLPDEEGRDETEELEEENPEDDYYQLSDPEDVETYMNQHAENGDPYQEAYDDPDANIGENTEIQYGDPRWDRIASDYLSGYTRNSDDFFETLQGHGHGDRFARGLESEMDPLDSEHRELVDQWNSSARDPRHYVDLPTPEAKTVEDYTGYHENDEPEDELEPEWDEISQDYLDNTRQYGDMTAPYRPATTGYQRFHNVLKNRSDAGDYDGHTSQMADALQRNVDWSDPDHQLAAQWWNDSHPEHNIYEQPQLNMDWDDGKQLKMFNQNPWSQEAPFTPWQDVGVNGPSGEPYRAGDMSTFASVKHGGWHTADEHQGYSNYDTFQVAVTYDNDQHLYNAVRQLVRSGGTPQQLEQWALSNVIGPINQSHIQDAQQWNDIPTDERQPDMWGEVNDEDPSNHMIDPGLVNWQELWTDLRDELGMQVDQPLTIPEGWSASSATNWEGLAPMNPISVRPTQPPADPQTDIQTVYSLIGEAVERGDYDTARFYYQFLPETMQPVTAAAPTVDDHHILAPAVELREWLADFGGSEPPSIHHNAEADFVQAPAVSTADDLPYYPPAEVPKELKQSNWVDVVEAAYDRDRELAWTIVKEARTRWGGELLLPKTADAPITQADATNDALGKSPALEPSPQGDPDYLMAMPCPHCQQAHRPDEPCPDSSVGQYQQQERQWYNRDPNAIHGAPNGLQDHQTDLGRTASEWTDGDMSGPLGRNTLSLDQVEQLVQSKLAAHTASAPDPALTEMRETLAKLAAAVEQMNKPGPPPEGKKPRKLVMNRDAAGRLESIEEV